ncbi:MAG: hypothetical protein NC238_06450 [Dehalobacter sp.]|nr:hypothetical protein [Dehalobacter sp.]
MKAKPIGLIFLILVLLIAGCIQPIANEPDFQIEETKQDYIDYASEIQMEVPHVRAEGENLILDLTISGLQNVVSVEEDFTNRVCDPLISLDPARSLTKWKAESDFTNISDWSKDIDISYFYKLEKPLSAQTNVTMDWTIGPCGPCFMEQNIPCDVFPLVTNHRFNFVIPES